MSRANARSVVFRQNTDYRAFELLMRRANDRLPMRILAWCLIPTHFHFVLWPYRDGDLSRWMHWLLTAHVHQHRRRHNTIGRIWQGRFKAPPIQQDHHLLIVLRYVERNPLRSCLVDRAEGWRWSSLRARITDSDSLLTASPVPLPKNWRELVNEPLTEAERAGVRESLQRGRPYGDRAWLRGTAERLGLSRSLRPRGRPPNRR